MFADLAVHDTRLEECQGLYSNAWTGFHTWKQSSFQDRIQYMRKMRSLIVTHLDELIDIICADTGKVPVEAVTADLLTVVDYLKHVEKHGAKALRPKKVPTPLALFGRKSCIEYQPRGVVLVISPWNYPFQLSLVPVIAAVFAGNSVILKPSEVTPKVGAAIKRLIELCEFPPGVVQVALGGKDLGAELVKGGPDYIFFTGSVRTGKIIQQEAAKRLIPTTLELGGKDPMIVCADANLKRAAKGAVWGAFTNMGQVCMSVERLYVERSVYDDFTAALVAEVCKLTQGSGPEHDLGAMTWPGQVEVVREHINDALAHGAKLITGLPPEQWDLSRGLFIPPMVLVDVTSEMKVMQEETFGPVLPVMPFDDIDEAVRLANGTSFGLNASVWSSDLKKARRIARELVSGNVVINDVIISVANPHLPFGGVKESGIGRYHGEVGLQTFCHQRAVVVSRGRRKSELNWYPYRSKLALFKKMVKLLYGRKR
ncbi:MAG: aldehyde dehydrogenase family protein [Limnochordia bacterium]|nr:aldehyde dehydrogenase family protein [Bacillota bacterium]HOB09268.1 aldehyde dehydrogenase family protein [Limnochordia bacterium]HQD71603.1 aldehyde dehydrogenase family protein [Limnochordia bacterium]